MRKTILGLLIASLCFVIHESLLTSAVADVVYSSVDISSAANFTWVNPFAFTGGPTVTQLPGAPTGAVTLGGIPFDLTSNSSGYQVWSGNVAAGGGYVGNAGGGNVSLTMPVNQYGVTNVYTLINTEWGQPGPASYASLVFTAANGSSYTYNLVGGVDIRDNNGALGSITTINGTTTTNVFTGTDAEGNPGYIDMQQIALPAAFANQTLSTIQLNDDGGPQFQRVFLSGVTVASVPEPSSLVLVGVSSIGLLAIAWRKRNQRLGRRE